MIRDITKHGKIYLPKEILHIDTDKPWRTTCNVPSVFRTGFMEVYEDNIGEHEFDEPDEEEQAFRAHLILSKRSFYRAFKSKASIVMELIQNISPELEVQILPEHCLLSPLWESKSHTVATNLLNDFFEDVMQAIGIPTNQWSAFFSSLKEDTLVHPFVVLASSKIMARKYIETIFPMETAVAHESFVDARFFKKWSGINKTIVSLNE